MTRTTPPRPIDITTAFPELAELARTAYRLHPVPGQPTVHDSSVGGPLLWPAHEPWPEFETTPNPWLPPATTLADLRLLRALVAAPSLSEEQQATLRRIHAGHPPQSLPPGPQPLIPVLQLYARDVPGLAFPPGTDLLQLLWAPSYEIESGSAAVQLRWRQASDVREVLLSPPEPAYVQVADCVPVPCVLHPEPVREFPSHHSLDAGLLARVRAWEAERHARDDYWNDLSVAPGWKAGGWPAHFTFRDPPEPGSDELRCGACGGPVDALLTVDSGEWDAATGSWCPVECAEAAEGLSGAARRSLQEPTQVSIGRGYSLQVYRCVGTPAHPPRFVMQ